MQLIITVDGTDTLVSIDIPHDAEFEILAQMVQAEVGVPIDEQVLELESVALQPGVLATQGVMDGSSIVVKRGRARQSNSATGAHSHQLIDPSSVPPERFLEIVQQNPAMLEQYRRLDAELGECLDTGDVNKLRVLLMKRLMSRHKVVYEARQEEIALMTADPMDPEVQKKIAEKIRLENVQENLNSAMENSPESFGSVTMLYVNLQVNGNPVKAFVDSGAQISIMSKRLADACGVSHLIDTRMVSQLRGVGTSTTLGRIHAVQIKFGDTFMSVSLTVVPNNDMDFLFGLDNLRRLRGVIDLDRNVLCLDGAGDKKEEVAFLGESELPETAKGNYERKKEEDGEAEGGAGGSGVKSGDSSGDSSANTKMDASST